MGNSDEGYLLVMLSNSKALLGNSRNTKSSDAEIRNQRVFADWVPAGLDSDMLSGHLFSADFFPVHDDESLLLLLVNHWAQEKTLRRFSASLPDAHADGIIPSESSSYKTVARIEANQDCFWLLLLIWLSGISDERMLCVTFSMEKLKKEVVVKALYGLNQAPSALVYWDDFMFGDLPIKAWCKDFEVIGNPIQCGWSISGQKVNFIAVCKRSSLCGIFFNRSRLVSAGNNNVFSAVLNLVSVRAQMIFWLVGLLHCHLTLAIAAAGNDAARWCSMMILRINADANKAAC
ncbi:hypothetical protein Tco_1204798 [Tanacetum coccineum]